MKIKDIRLPDESTRILINARQQLQRVERAYKRCQNAEKEHTLISSPRMDGMPRGTRTPYGLEKRYIDLEKYHRQVKQEESKLQELREKAQQVIYSLPDILQDFCSWYYVEGMSMPDVAAWIDRDISTCWRYKRVIEGDAACSGQNAASERFID